MSSLYIVIPAYNEAENIEMVINDWYPIVEKYNDSNGSRLIIVNDGSKDNTYEILCEIAKTKPLLVVLNKKNGGHGSAVLFGYKYAIKMGADYIFQTDSDGQTVPEEFYAFWNLRKDYDAIIGSRPNRKDGIFRLFVEKVLCSILLLIFGVRISDSNAPFRLMRRELLDKYIRRLPEDYFLPNVMLTTFFSYYNEKIKFINITFECRKAGNNSINIPKIVRIGINSVKGFWNIRKNMTKNI